MFQQKRARMRDGIGEIAGQIHMAHLALGLAAQMRRCEVVAVEALAAAAVEVIEAGARLADIAGGDGQQRAGAEDIAAHGLALQPLAQPHQRGAAAIEARRLFDQPRRHAGDRLAPFGRAGIERRLDLLPAQRMAVQIVAVEQAFAADDMQQREGQRGIAAGEGLEMEIGRRCRGMADRIDDDLAGRAIPAAIAYGRGAPRPRDWRPRPGCRRRRAPLRGSKPV